MPAVRGTAHPASKLTEQAVKEIRRDYRPGWVTLADLAEKHNVSLQLISQIIKRQAWSWVDDEPPAPRKTSGALGLFFYAPNQGNQ